MNEAQTTLHEKYLEMKRRNPQFTLRAFARRLGLSSGALSEILSGKRKVTQKNAQRIAENLCLDPQETRRLLGGTTELKDQYHDLSHEQFHVISDWWHFAILNLVKTKDFVADEKWIAQRLGLSTTVATEAIERLFKLGFLTKGPKSQWLRAQPRLQSTDDVVNLSARRSHFQDLDLIRDSLASNDIAVRDATSITFAIDAAKLKEAKAFLRRFQDEFIARFETQSTNEVYRLSTQLFPLSRR